MSDFRWKEGEKETLTAAETPFRCFPLLHGTSVSTGESEGRKKGRRQDGQETEGRKEGRKEGDNRKGKSIIITLAS